MAVTMPLLSSLLLLLLPAKHVDTDVPGRSLGHGTFSAAANMTLFLPYRSTTMAVATAAEGRGDSWSTLVAADAAGAAGAAALSASPAPMLSQVVVEVNTLWAPFATACTIVNQSLFSVTWRCSQPATRGAPDGEDSITCDCNQNSMRYPVPAMRAKCACHRMLELAVGRLNLSLSASAIAGNDTFRGPTRAIRAAVGGFFYSLQPAGQCSTGANGSAPCTWRVVSSGTPKNSSCLALQMQSLARGQVPNCFAACPKPRPVHIAERTGSACAQRCVAAGLAQAGTATVERAWRAVFDGPTCSLDTASDEFLAPKSLATPLPQQQVLSAKTLQLYRLAPRSLAVDMVNANSGDTRGDVFFGVVEAQLQCYVPGGRASGSPFSCSKNPMNEGKALRLNTAVYTRFTTEVNTLFGDYTMCNAVEVRVQPQRTLERVHTGSQALWLGRIITVSIYL